MRRMTAVALLAAVLLILTLPFGVPAEDAAPETEQSGVGVFQVGKTLELFEKDGLSVSLEGGIVMLDMSKPFPVLADIRDENASVALTAIVENRSEKDLYIEYTGSVNGISLGEQGHSLVSVHVLTAGSRNAVYIVFQKEWLNGQDVRQLKSCELAFRVCEKPTNSNNDNVLLYDIPAIAVRFDQATSAGMSFIKGEDLTVLAQNGLQIVLSAAEVSKGGEYLILGARVTNNTGKTIKIQYQSRINGWDLGGYWGTPTFASDGNPAKSIFPDTATAELIMPVTLYGWNKIRSAAELESIELNFRIHQVDGSGNGPVWFFAPTGKIWINRTTGTVSAETLPAAGDASADSETLAAVPAPVLPEKKEFRLMFGLAFGDTMAEVRSRIKESGGSCYEESGALHGNAELFSLPNKSFDYLFSDSGKLNCVRNVCVMKNRSADDAETAYRNMLSELTGYFGEPNGRGATEQKQSVNEQFYAVASTIVTGVYHDYIQHVEWFVPDAQPYPLKIDLFFEESGNRESGDYGTVIEVDIEARGL